MPIVLFVRIMRTHLYCWLLIQVDLYLAPLQHYFSNARRDQHLDGKKMLKLTKKFSPLHWCWDRQNPPVPPALQHHHPPRWPHHHVAWPLSSSVSSLSSSCRTSHASPSPQLGTSRCSRGPGKNWWYLRWYIVLLAKNIYCCPTFLQPLQVQRLLSFPWVPQFQHNFLATRATASVVVLLPSPSAPLASSVICPWPGPSLSSALLALAPSWTSRTWSVLSSLRWSRALFTMSRRSGQPVLLIEGYFKKVL